MLCPHCKVELKITDRQGIEIDYCPNCRGVWLDRGELDKILDRSAAAIPAPGGYTGHDAPPPPRGGWRYDDDDDDDDRRRYYGQPGYGHPGYDQRGYRRRRESWLGDLFDFD
jgi:Zn-finger nucleic acid-binding protein